MSKKYNRGSKVRLSSHADIRIDDRVPLPWEAEDAETPDLHTRKRVRSKLRRRLLNEIRKRLDTTLRLGIQPDEYGAIHVFLEGGYEAILMADVGHWTVLTILGPVGVRRENRKEGETA